ncbi:glycosyltransferase family 4 protein [Amphritea sp. HPY]|uniref:glycosyltransferase family 4 protein n=1 Tax=Amphritea sp. HPY TaxID=3421652 RepID=UPI003D7C617A
MKVLHVFKTYFPDTVGGVEQVINQIAIGTVKLGVTTEVFALSRTAKNRTINVNGHLVHRCRSNFELASTPFSVSAFYRFRRLAKEADLVHYHFPYPFADVLHLSAGINKPSLVTYHSDIVKQKQLLKLYRPLQQRFLNSVDHIVATSPNYLQTSNVLSGFKSKTSVIPIGLDNSSYPKASTARLNVWRERFGSRFFLFVGVIRYYKGLHILLDAAQKSSYPIVIVGSGPIEVELKEKAAKLGLRNIHFLGRLSDEDKVALLELCYAVIFPSHLRSEAFGISLLEGAMYGKPLISSEIGTGTTYINIDKETGVVVPPSNPSALRDAMDYLWNNPEEADAMGKRAEARYCKLFTAKQMAQSYVDTYKGLLDQRIS